MSLKHTKERNGLIIKIIKKTPGHGTSWWHFYWRDSWSSLLLLCAFIQHKVTLGNMSVLWRWRTMCAWQLQRWMGEILQFINLTKISLLAHSLFVLSSVSPYFPSYPRKMSLCNNSISSMREQVIWGEFVLLWASRVEGKLSQLDRRKCQVPCF